MFQIDRRIVFYNGVTGDYILSIKGKCSIKKDITENQLEVTCKVGPNSYKKHYLGISDNVTYFAEQLYFKDVSAYHYEVIFKPQSIIGYKYIFVPNRTSTFNNPWIIYF